MFNVNYGVFSFYEKQTVKLLKDCRLSITTECI